MSRHQPPPREVLQAFGLPQEMRRLPGGAGTSWQVGDMVLKPGCDPVMQEWLGVELAAVDQEGFRLAQVARADDGRWVVDGWGAAAVLPGVAAGPVLADWPAVVEAGRAFHRAVRALPRPPWLSRRRDWWALADAATWDGGPVEVIAPLRTLVSRLRRLLEPLGPDQLVHGDLTSNVLLAPGRLPGIIDVSPYWRPHEYGEGIVVADAICWYDAPSSLIDVCGVRVSAVARGLLFRVLTTNGMQAQEPNRAALERELLRYTDAVGLLGL